MRFIIVLFDIAIKSDIHAQQNETYKELIIGNIAWVLTICPVLVQALLYVLSYLILIAIQRDRHYYYPLLYR